MRIEKRVKQIFNLVLSNNDLIPIEDLNPEKKLQTDLEMDSIILAELTVRIEDEFNVDIFENGMVHTIGDVLNLISQKQV